MKKSAKKLDLTLPDNVDVLGVRFQVQVVDQVDEEGSDGETNGTHRRIKIASHQDTRRRWTTLLHEFMHAVFDVNGIASIADDDLEEVQVQSLEHALEQFLLAHGKQLLAALQVQKEDIDD